MAGPTHPKQAGGQKLAHRLVGKAVEKDQGNQRLHVQIDVPAQGFQQSLLRCVGSMVELTVEQ
jgi:hypothetical protein